MKCGNIACTRFGRLPNRGFVALAIIAATRKALRILASTPHQHLLLDLVHTPFSPGPLVVVNGAL